MIEEKVKEMLAEVLHRDESDIELDYKLYDDLGADSIDIVDFIVSVEKEFDISIDAEDEESCDTVQKIVDLIKVKTNKP